MKNVHSLRVVELMKGMCCLLIIFVGLATHLPVQSAEADTWTFWNQSNDRNYKTIDHSQWDQLLSRYVVTSPDSGVRQFRYSAFSPQDQKLLDRYIASLAAIDPREYRKDEQKAYWMNLYNALSVQLIIDNYSHHVSSTASHSLSDREKSRSVVKIEGKRLSLDDIENQILRPIWRDHRVHFGLNRGSMDAPNMDARAYTALTIKQQLKDSGVSFINDDRGVRFSGGTLFVAQLFGDYQSDFAQDRKTLLKLLAHYVRDKKALYLLAHQGPISYVSNKALNSPQ